jgi:hypothetical protein
VTGVTPIETTRSNQVTLGVMVTRAALDVPRTSFDLGSAQPRSGVGMGDPGRNASLFRRVSMPAHG